MRVDFEGARLEELYRKDYPGGTHTLVSWRRPATSPPSGAHPHWTRESSAVGRKFGHLAYRLSENIYRHLTEPAR